MTYENRLVLSWEQIDASCDRLIQLVKDRISGLRGIAAISRGGLVPASILSYEMNLPIVDILLPNNPRVILGHPRGEGLLIVDDVCDTGITFSQLKAFYPCASFATLDAKPQGRSKCDYVIFAYGVAQQTWIVYPWAPNDSPKSPLAIYCKND